MKKVVGWVRTEKKAGMDRQREAIKAYCLADDAEIVDWIESDNFGDIAYGNWMGHRRIDAVVAESNITVTGNVFVFHAYRCKLQMRNSNLVVTKWSDYPGYRIHQRALEELVSIQVDLEMAHEPVRNATGRIRKASKGGYIGGNAPMGYKVVDGRLEVNAEEVPVVLFIMEEKHRGGTKLGTVQKLNASGYKTRRGGDFQISTVQGIWNNEKFYRGYYRLKGTGEWVKGQHEAILKD